MIKEAELDGQKLFGAVSELENDAELSEKMASNAKAAGVPDAADRLLSVLESFVR